MTDPDAIRQSITDTRQRMSNTLDQIGDRLNPQHVKHRIREATIGRAQDMAQHASERAGEARRGIANTIRDNPIPATLVGLGLGWMIWNGRNEEEPRSPGYEWQGIGSASRIPEHSAGGYGAADYTQYEERGAGVGAAVSEQAERMRENVRETSGELAERAQDVAQQVSQRTRIRAQRAEDRFYDNPLFFGAIAVAVGLAAGLAAPRTHAEVELMGDVRDRLGDSVRETTEDIKEKAGTVAQRAAGEVRSAAHDEGLTARP
ncbi:MAG TPA: DUF3618 domain-containing protein [Gemmatimonadaceae bacterium]|nr:DUF3618 domain-containing protein [Gemmatimonadaceae bacterium]